MISLHPSRAPQSPNGINTRPELRGLSALRRWPPILPRHVRVRRRSRIKSLPPRSQGLDVLIAGVRDQGFSAATAKKAVHAVRDAWIRGLARGEEVDVGCGHLASVWRGGDPKLVTRKAGTGGRLKHEESPEPRIYQRDALPIRVAFRPSVAFRGEVVELITPEFRNFQRWVPGQRPRNGGASAKQLGLSRCRWCKLQLRNLSGSQCQRQTYSDVLPGLNGGSEKDRSQPNVARVNQAPADGAK